MINPSSVNPLTLPSVALAERSQLPSVPCIYFAIDSLGVVQYIGRSVNLAQRWLSHHRCKQLDSLGGVRIAYLFVDSAGLLPSLEAALINWFDPPLNATLVPRQFLATQKPKVSVYLDQKTLNWLQTYCKTQERSASAQLAFMIKSLKQEVKL